MNLRGELARIVADKDAEALKAQVPTRLTPAEARLLLAALELAEKRVAVRCAAEGEGLARERYSLGRITLSTMLTAQEKHSVARHAEVRACASFRAAKEALEQGAKDAE